MRRSHRKTHPLLWALIVPLVLFGFWRAVDARPSMPAQPSPVASELPKTLPPATEVTEQ